MQTLEAEFFNIVHEFINKPENILEYIPEEPLVEDEAKWIKTIFTKKLEQDKLQTRLDDGDIAVKVVANQTVVQAQAQARANVARASGEGQAIKIITEQLKQSPQYLQWQAINRWNGQMPYALGSGRFPFFQLPLQRQRVQNQTRQ